jgi:hypothetical protein
VSWRSGRLVALALLAACGRPPKTEVARARPSPIAARDLLSVDLDFVVRVDVTRLRATPDFPRMLERWPVGEGPRMFRKLRARVKGATALELGGRLFADGFRGDAILVIEGEATDEAPDADFRPVVSPRSDVRLFERIDSAAPAADRAEPVLEAHCGGGGVAIATAAEADAVLRILREGPDSARVEPPAHGMLSFAGRAPTGEIAADGKSAWAKLARGLRKFEGSIDLVDGIETEIDLGYASAEDAAEALAVAHTFVGRLELGEKPLRALADSIRLSPREDTLGVRFKVPLDLLAAFDWGRLASPANNDDTRGPGKP